MHWEKFQLLTVLVAVVEGASGSVDGQHLVIGPDPVALCVGV